jgi:peptidoglycan/xylan/chitin deacetylase (PgdA/CDA1 family)
VQRGRKVRAADDFIEESLKRVGRSVKMKRATYITTSWDDGHPLDLRVAELLAKYGLQGTFYIPRSTKTATMTTRQLRELSETFEVGGHTLHHVELTQTTQDQARQEITACKTWLEDSTGQPCSMFCPPKGIYASRHLDLILRAGYLGVRTVELLSLDFPRPVLSPREGKGLLMLPTTVQAHPHGLFAYVRNLGLRAAYRNFCLFLAHGRSTNWTSLVQSLVSRALKCGGVFHLWGHSWEVEQTGQWQRLEEVLRFLSQLTSQATTLTNSQVCKQPGAGCQPASQCRGVR